MISPTRYVRLFSDEHGETHFEDIEVQMKAIRYAPPAPAVHLSDPVGARPLDGEASAIVIALE